MGRLQGIVLGACWAVACGGSLSSPADDAAKGGTSALAGSGQHVGGTVPVSPSRGGAGEGGSEPIREGGACGAGAAGGGAAGAEPGGTGPAIGGAGGASTCVARNADGGFGGACCDAVSCAGGEVEVNDGQGCTVCELEGCESQRQGYVELIEEVRVKYANVCTTQDDCASYSTPDRSCGVARCYPHLTAAALPEMAEKLTAYAAASCNLDCPEKVVDGVLYTGGLWDFCEPVTYACRGGHCRED